MNCLRAVIDWLHNADEEEKNIASTQSDRVLVAISNVSPKGKEKRKTGRLFLRFH
jgi:hypothetical protein